MTLLPLVLIVNEMWSSITSEVIKLSYGKSDKPTELKGNDRT